MGNPSPRGKIDIELPIQIDIDGTGEIDQRKPRNRYFVRKYLTPPIIGAILAL